MKYLSIPTIAVCLALTSCGSTTRPPSELADAKPQGIEQSTIKGVQQMQAMHHQDTVTWRGRLYKFSISRSPDTDLPIVTDDSGARYADNRVEITINTDKGDTFFKQTFTKALFEQYLTADFRKYGVLEGMAFDVDRNSDSAIRFAASICYPQTDLFVAFEIAISSSGAMTITKSDSYDDPAPGKAEEEGV